MPQVKWIVIVLYIINYGRLSDRAKRENARETTMEVDFTWERAVNDEGNYNPERNQEVGFIRLRINSKQRLDFAIELSYLAIN